MPGLRDGDPRRAACRRAGRRLRASHGSRRSDARDPQPRLAPRHGRAGGGAVRRQAGERHGRRDPRPRRRGAGEPYEDLLARIRSAPALNVDETGWRLRGRKRTLWGAVTPKAAVFRIAPDRHEREAAALLGEGFEGIVGSDRWWAYRGFDPKRRQACWSHLIRDLTAHSEGLAAQKEFGEAGLDIARRLFSAWDEFQEHGDRRRLKREVAPLKQELKALLERGSKGRRNKLTWGFSKNLLKIWPALWTFVEVEGVEPTNNRAERALRGPVIYRKLSLGSQSERGETTTQRLLSASVTCRLQGRSLFAYLAEVLDARVRGDPAPLLA